MDNTNKLLYMKIIDYVKDKINTGVYLPQQQIPTEMYFAEQFAVSRITSRRALIELEKEGIIIRRKGSGSFVAPIVQKDESFQRKPENNTGMPKIISILLPYAYEAGNLMKTILGVSDYIKGKDYFLSIQNISDNLIDEKEFSNDISEGKIHGVIYYPISNIVNMEFLTKLYMNEFPIVTIDKYFENIPLNCVVSDNYAGSYETTQYLIGLGHKRIAFISNIGIEEAGSVMNRYMGYCKALKDNNIIIDNEINVLNYNKKINALNMESIQEFKSIKAISDPIIQEFMKDMIRRLIQQGVTAIQCVNDIVAMYMMKACLDMGIEIPKQLSIVGFDNIELSEHLEIPLTTVEQDFYNIGKKAAEILIKNIEDGKVDYQKVTLPVKLIERQSSGVANTDIH